jgi:excisionase family DNA binding protein
MDSTAVQTPVERRAAHEPDTLAAQAWLRSGQVATLLGVHPRTVLRWADAGRLPYVATLGGQRRFPNAQVQALLARRCGQAPEAAGELLRTGEVARRLRVPARTVARWSRQGRLASLRTLGGHRRYPRAQVDQLLSQPGGGTAPGRVDDFCEGPAPTAAADRSTSGHGPRHHQRPPVIVGQAAMHDNKAVVGHPRWAGLEIARTEES